MAETLFDVLKSEHKEITRLRDKAEKDPRRFAEFAEELNTHVHAEEKVFYTPLKDSAPVHEMVLEGFAEHHVVDLIITDMDRDPAGSDEWQAKFKVMSENLDHHIQEEEKELFPAAEKVLGRQRAVELSREYSHAEELITSAGRG
ncbi:MAG: hemerythrin domain-containing protein [Coriobacteriia bacterium]